MLADYPVQIPAPDITPYRGGNRGLDYCWTFGSARPGPHLLVSAVVHGNELCGAYALDFLLSRELRPLRGTLTLTFMNVEAFLAFDPATPSASRFLDEDFNRLWDREVLDGSRDSRELRRARQVRPVVDEADILLDLHSMQHDSEPLTLSGPLEKGRSLARAVGVPATVVSDAGHAAGRRLRDYGGFADPASAKNALLVECGQHWTAGVERVALEVTLRCLLHLRMLDPDVAAPHLGAQPPQQRFVEVTEAVTIGSERFAFVRDFQGGEVIPRAGTLLAYDDGQPVRTPYDDCILVMPSRRLTRGLTAVRLGRFVPS